MRHDTHDHDGKGPQSVEDGRHDASEIFADPVSYLMAHGIGAELVEVGSQALAPAA